VHGFLNRGDDRAWEIGNGSWDALPKKKRFGAKGMGRIVAPIGSKEARYSASGLLPKRFDESEFKTMPRTAAEQNLKRKKTRLGGDFKPFLGRS